MKLLAGHSKAQIGWLLKGHSLTAAVPSGDTTAPIINTFTYDDTTKQVTLDITEASGSSTVVWATSNTDVTPTYTIGGGWAGATYETGSFTSTSGGDTDAAAITATTPDGARKLTIYARDASNNLSLPDSTSISVDNTAPEMTAAELAADGVTLTLTYNETLAGTAAAVDYTVNADAVGITVSNAVRSGITVTLTLASAINNGQTVTVSYSGTAIEDEYGNDAAALTNSAVTNGSTQGVVTSLSYIGAYGNTDHNSAANFTQPAADIGAADADRRVVVALSFFATANGDGVSGVTIGGVTATKLDGAAQFNLAYMGAEVWAASVPTGTTADIVVSFSGVVSDLALNVYRLIKASSFNTFATVPVTGNSSTAIMDINTKVNGAALYVMQNINGTASTPPTGFTETYDVDINTNEWAASGFITGIAAEETPRTVRSTFSAATRYAALAVSWS